MNTGILFVPQQEAWVVERMGKFYKTLNPVSKHKSIILIKKNHVYLIRVSIFLYPFLTELVMCKV